MADLLSVLRPLFEPRHVAVIGASRTPGKRGHTVTRNLIRCGFPGRISPINPASEEVEGLTCYPSIASLPERVDCAFIALPAQQSVEALRQCAAAGVGAVVVGSNGFAESGTKEGHEREAELTAIARASGMRVVGPNTNGVFNANARLSLGYNHSHSEPIAPGAISVVSHSGAMFDGIAGRLRKAGVGLAKFVPVGNEADLDLMDFLDYFIDDPQTRVIGLVIEGLSDGHRFRRLAERAADVGKPIVALKVGRSTVGAEAALAHSSRLAGSARAYDALFEACGVAGVRTIEGLVGSCSLLAGRVDGPRPEDRRIICVTSSGAGGALVADFAAESGLPLAGDCSGAWEEPAASTIAALPTIAKIRNPLDTGSLGNWRLMFDIFAALNTAGCRGPIVVYAHNMPERRLEETLAEVLAMRRKQISAPVVILAPGGLSETMEAVHRGNGVAIFHDIASCFESLKAYDAIINRAMPARRKAPFERVPLPAEATRLLQRAAARPAVSSFLSEIESAEVLRLHGVPMVESRIVASAHEASAVADALGCPVVLKALAPGVAHKNDRGFVIAGIGDEKAVREAYATLERRLTAAGFARTDATIILQPMLQSQAELIVGVTHEPPLGHFLVVGLGGVFAELLDEVMLIPLPTDDESMRARVQTSMIGAMVARLGGGALMDQLIAALEALQNLVMSNSEMIESVDVNPLLVGDETCIAVDALVVLKRAQDRKQYAAG